MTRPAAVLLAVALVLPAPLLAQGQPRDDERPGPLPVSLARIKRELRERESRPQSQRLKLSYYVAVVGANPQIDLFKNFDTRHGPVPMSAPTHQELFNQVTPQEFRAPAADVLGAARWVGSKLSRGSSKDSER
jgi:hypothetical protein